MSRMNHQVYKAMIACDPMLLLEMLIIGNQGATGGLKQGEVAFGGLKKPVLRIFNPNNPQDSIICRNNLSYPQLENNVVFMNPTDYSYFTARGFEAGDMVYIIDDSKY